MVICTKKDKQVTYVKGVSDVDIGFSYNFPAIRGIQADKEFFIAMCPLRVIPKIFLFDEEEIPPEFRAQRIINKNRVPEITNYILDNRKDYVFSSLTASIDGDITFIPSSNQPGLKETGILTISLDSRFLINDGQHRRAAIEEALRVNPDLGNETISVVFFIDKGLERAQQMFADLNRHSVNTTSSIGILYDHRDQLAITTKDIIDSNVFLKRYTDKEKVSLSKNSPKLLSLNHLFNTNLKILDTNKGDPINKDQIDFLYDFWSEVVKSIDEWVQILNKDLTPKQLRANYIVGHGVFLEALGLVGHQLYIEYRKNWRTYISKLSKIDWSRTRTDLWQNRAIGKNGRVTKNNTTIKLTAIQIKKLIDLPLTQSEQIAESKFMEEISS